VRQGNRETERMWTERQGKRKIIRQGDRETERFSLLLSYTDSPPTLLLSYFPTFLLHYFPTLLLPYSQKLLVPDTFTLLLSYSPTSLLCFSVPELFPCPSPVFSKAWQEEGIGNQIFTRYDVAFLAPTTSCSA
jgi:hypothetical protein